MRIKEALDIFLGTSVLTSFFLWMFNIGSTETIGKRTIVIGNRTILRIYTKSLNYDLGAFVFLAIFLQDLIVSFLHISMRTKVWQNCDRFLIV